MPRERKYGNFVTFVRADGVLLDAESNITDLYDDMDSWASNMEGTNLEGTEKYEILCEVRDTLENCQTQLGSIELEFLKPVDEEVFSYTELRKRFLSRNDRLGNIISLLGSYIEFLRDGEYVDEDQLGEIEDIISDLEGVEFPSMFG